MPFYNNTLRTYCQYLLELYGTKLELFYSIHSYREWRQDNMEKDMTYQQRLTAEILRLRDKSDRLTQRFINRGFTPTDAREEAVGCVLVEATVNIAED